MDIIKINCNGKETQLPRSMVEVDELAFIFNVRADGMHMKAFDGRVWKNIYPSGNKRFEGIPENCKETLLIALQSQQSTSTESKPQTPSLRLHNRRGNAALSTPPFPMGATINRKTYDQGPRAIPSFKNSVPVPCKKRKPDACFKMICVSDVDTDCMDGQPYTIYEVPVDLAKLHDQFGDFGIDEIQQEVAYQIGGTAYVLTNKKGNPIRNMPNTRGIYKNNFLRTQRCLSVLLMKLGLKKHLI